MMSIESEREPSYHESPTQEEKAVNGKKDFLEWERWNQENFPQHTRGLPEEICMPSYPCHQAGWITNKWGVQWDEDLPEMPFSMEGA